MLWLTVLVPFVYGIYVQEVLKKPFGDNPMSTEGLIVVGIASVVVMGLILVFMFVSKLKTKITTEAIYIAYPPLFRKPKKITPDLIDRFEVRKYRPIGEYGGYGIKNKHRRRRKSNMAYIVSGNVGLQLYFKSGKKLLIGTQRKQAIQYAMEKLMEKKSGE